MTRLVKFIGDLILHAHSAIKNCISEGYKKDLYALTILSVVGFLLWATLKSTNLEYINNDIPRWLVYNSVLLFSMIFLGVKLHVDKARENQIFDSTFISEAMARDTDEYRMKNKLYLDFSDQVFEEEELLSSNIILEAITNDTDEYRMENELYLDFSEQVFEEEELLSSKFILEAMANDTDEYRMENELYLDFSEQVFGEDGLHSKLISEAIAKDTDEYRMENEIYPELFSLEHIEQEQVGSVEVKEREEINELDNWFFSSTNSRYKFRGFDRGNVKLVKIFPSTEDLDNFCRFLNNEELSPSTKINITSYPGSRQRNIKTIFCLFHYCFGDLIEEISGKELEVLINGICKYFANNGHALDYKSVNSAFSNWRGLLLQNGSNRDSRRVVQECVKITKVFENDLQELESEKNNLQIFYKNLLNSKNNYKLL